jgi:arylsulfatase A-like enzyme
MQRYITAIKRRLNPQDVRFVLSLKKLRFILQNRWGWRSFKGENNYKHDRPNVLFISVDSLRDDHLGCYGYHRNTSPNIDKFAKESIVFKNTICQAPWTKPSVGSMLTSLYPAVHGADSQGEHGENFGAAQISQNVSVLNKSAVTIAEILRDNGYATAGFTGGGYTHSFFGFSKGFDTYHDNAGGIKTVNFEIFDWLKKNTGKPFFIFTHFFDVHYPFTVIPPYGNMFGTYKSNVNVDRQFEIDVNSGKRKLNKEDINRLVSLYDGGIFYTDRQLGLLFDMLKKMGCYDNTIIILTSDHGEGFMEHDLIAHADIMYNEVMRIPLIIRWPELGNDVSVNNQVRSIDIMPTILDFVGIEPPSRIHGVSLHPMIGGEAKDNLIAFSETERRGFQKAVMDGKDKLLYNCTSKKEEFFNLSKDPGEKFNKATEHYEKLEYMRSLLESWNKYLEMHKAEIQSGDIQKKEKMDNLVVEQLKGLGYI